MVSANISPVNERQLGRVHRALRKRLGLTQRELAKRAAVPRNKISDLECFRLANLSLPEIDRCFTAMDASLRFFAEWHGAALDRLLDEGHAALVGAISGVLRELGWQVEFEVTFAKFGDRGSIDVLAWHAHSRTLLVIEVKTELGSLEGTLRSFDVKVRLAPVVAAERFGWQAQMVDFSCCPRIERFGAVSLGTQKFWTRLCRLAIARCATGWLARPTRCPVSCS